MNFGSDDEELKREESQGDSIPKEGHVSEKEAALVVLDLPKQSLTPGALESQNQGEDRPVSSRPHLT